MGIPDVILRIVLAFWMSIWSVHPVTVDHQHSVPAKPKVVHTSGNPWRHDYNISWYGPGFYGHRTACGLPLTTKLVGVAHRTLPCGTLIEFRWKGKTVVVRVVDRGPYVQGRIFDLTGGACTALGHCFTGPIDWRLVNGR
jgi:rare lipoprotein A (peptidoglycan hydrolase)